MTLGESDAIYRKMLKCMQHRRQRLHNSTRRTIQCVYTVVLEREEDGGYVASVPALPGCVSQGDTRSEALNNIREAIELYVEDCRDAGDPVSTEAGKEFVEIEAA
jgi:predicted RNase H-like HicB family nuclease